MECQAVDIIRIARRMVAKVRSEGGTPIDWEMGLTLDSILQTIADLEPIDTDDQVVTYMFGLPCPIQHFFGLPYMLSERKDVLILNYTDKQGEGSCECRFS